MAIDLSGQKFGRLTVVERSEVVMPNVGRLWRCICDCGKEKFFRTAVLRNGEVKSCNCYRWGGHPLPRGESACRSLYSEYKKSGKEFKLTLDEFKKLTKQKCNYCGCPPGRTKKGRHKKSGDYVYNGIDRKDNSIGYLLENCVPCCWRCNQMKRALSDFAFIGHIEKIYKNTVGRSK